MRRDVAQRFSATQAIGAFQMRGKVTIAEAKPRLATDEFQRRHEIPRLARKAPTQLRIGATGEGVHDRVDIGRDRKTEMREVVSGVDHDQQILRREDRGETVCKLRATDATGERNDHDSVPR